MTRRLHRLGCAMFVCFAACHNDGAPPAAGPTAGSTETAGTLDSAPSAAGGPAVAASGTGSAMPSAAGAPAAAASGTGSAAPIAAGAPAAAGSGMASTGTAGSSAAAMPVQQPAANPPAAGGCELPNTYTRASRVTLELTWPETIAITAGTGRLVVWLKATYTRNSAGAIELDSRPCGFLIPEMTFTELVGGQKSGIQIPFTAFDSLNIPLDRMPITQREDRSLTFALSTVLGAMLPDPDGAWPSAASLVPLDHDGDGLPGLTALPLEGPEYLAPPSSVAQTESLDRLYIASRARARVSITPSCSGATNGTVEPLGFNSTVVGCHVKDRDDCAASETRFIANQMPRYMLGASGTWTEVEVPQAASCADVRAALPAP